MVRAVDRISQVFIVQIDGGKEKEGGGEEIISECGHNLKGFTLGRPHLLWGLVA